MDDINKLRNLLVFMHSILEKLLSVEKEKTTVLEQGDMEKLNALINEEQALAMECQSAEKQRIELCTRIGVESMSELYEKFPDKKEVISSIHSKLTETVNEIKKVNAVNTKLLDTRLKIVKFISAQMGVSAEEKTYTKMVKNNK